MINIKKHTVFVGHYGSGKTQAALNYALFLKKKCDNVILADLDIVNPYFRTHDGGTFLKTEGIRLIASDYANSNLDVPSIPPGAQAIFDGDAYSVLDVGGDDRGALALGRYSAKLKDAAIWLVINRFRPQTPDATGILDILREIEAAARVKVNGLVNNSNLGVETTASDVIGSEKYARSVSEHCGIPVVLTTVCDSLYSEVERFMTNPFAIRIFRKNAWRL